MACSLRRLDWVGVQCTVDAGQAGGRPGKPRVLLTPVLVGFNVEFPLNAPSSPTQHTVLINNPRDGLGVLC